MQSFTPTTAEQEARALTLGCLQAIASGWPVIYFRQSQTIGLNGTQATAAPDIPAMIRAAANMAVQLTEATATRRPAEGWHHEALFEQIEARRLEAEATHNPPQE